MFPLGDVATVGGRIHFALAIVALLLRRVGRGLRRTADWYFGIMYGLVFMACAANIPYFSYFSRTLNSSIWQWFAYPAQTAGMLFGEAAWLKYILLYVCVCVLFVALLRFLTCREASHVYELCCPCVFSGHVVAWATIPSRCRRHIIASTQC